MLALLLACSTPDAPAPAAFTPDLSKYAPAEATCVQGSCADAKSAAELEQCRAQRCPATAEQWTVDPTLLRYDGNVVTMSVNVGHDHAAYGDTPVAAESETWLGATVLKKDGEEIDMAVHTVFPDRLDEPFTFSSEVGPDVDVVIVGLWGEKIEPCDSTRSGCKMFGFVLDKSLGAWPTDTYTATPPLRQRFLPAKMTVQQKYADPAASAVAVNALRDVWKLEGERFGTTFEGTDRLTFEQALTTGAAAPAAPGAGFVLYKHPNDGPLATRVAGALVTGGTAPKACFDAAASADLVVDLTAAPPAGAACR